MTDIDKLKELAEAATPGPWDTLHGTTVRAIKGDLAVPIFRSEAPVDWHKNKNLTHPVLCKAYADEVNNAAFIALCREAVPSLIAEVERLREILGVYVDASKNQIALREKLEAAATKAGWTKTDGHDTEVLFRVKFSDLCAARAALGRKP